MSFPKDFLTDIAREKDLTPKETEVFLALFGDGKSRVQITQDLYISNSAIGTRLSGIYKKFSISGSGPVKESQLKDYLTKRCLCLGSTESATCADLEQNIDVLVQEVRSHCCEAILDSYSKIRLLDDTRIDVDLLYVDVYVLEKLSSKRPASISGLLEGVEQREDYERLALGQRQDRLPGQEIVPQFPRLMVLGKPGSGKTTFLRHLAVDCSKGKFFCDRIPVLIELRSIKEGNSFNLLNLIHRKFGLAQHEQTQQILNQGKAFILLDGLDEVPSQLRQSIRDQIYEFAKEYRKNRFVLTCRTQTIECTADNFQPIEVADFDAEQVEIFVHKWFTATPETSGQVEEWISRFVEKLVENEQIRELAVTPILLTLTCLLFTAQQDLPKKRSELYEKGSNLLLKQWDRFREIPRDYQQLSVSDKQKLLSYLAFRKFEQPDNFILFEQDEIQGYIAEHLKIEAEESEAVLKAIEAHHGLLIERANGIWSFSRLTFQEYFTAKYIVDSSTPEEAFQRLVSHITEPRWREVFLLVVDMLPSADKLLQLMKQQVDSLLADDESLQLFLFWIYWKSLPVSDNYYKPAIRVFYLCLEEIYSLGLFRFDEPIDLAERFGVHVQDIPLGIVSLDFDQKIYDLLHFFCYSSWFSPKDALATNIDDIFENFKLHPDLKEELQQLKDNLPELPDPDREKQKFKEVWANVSPIRTDQLRSLMIKYRNIGHDWQLREEQIELLRQYHDANEFLLECMDSDVVSQDVRQEIEEALLLPSLILKSTDYSF